MESALHWMGMMLWQPWQLEQEKPSFFILLMLVIRAISKDPTLTLDDVTFPKDPAMIVVCPTKALQEDMVYIKLFS
jgi:hypothetical protein